MKHVLVVDDHIKENAINFKAFGIEVLVPLPDGFVGVSTVLTAFQKLNTEHWDHVITDLRLPVEKADRSGLPDRTPDNDRVLDRLAEKFNTATLCSAYKARRATVRWAGGTSEKIEWVLGRMARKPLTARDLEGNGLALVETCWERNIPFTVYTEKWGHTQYSIVALVTNQFIGPEQVAEVLAMFDAEYPRHDEDLDHYWANGSIVISGDKSFAMGPKTNSKNWTKIFQAI